MPVWAPESALAAMRRGPDRTAQAPDEVTLMADGCLGRQMLPWLGVSELTRSFPLSPLKQNFLQARTLDFGESLCIRLMRGWSGTPLQDRDLQATTTRIFRSTCKLLPTRCPLGDTGGNRLPTGEDSVSSSGWRTSPGSPRLARQFWAVPLQKKFAGQATFPESACSNG
jgi:hypothetical protein